MVDGWGMHTSGGEAGPPEEAIPTGSSVVLTLEGCNVVLTLEAVAGCASTGGGGAGGIFGGLKGVALGFSEDLLGTSQCPCFANSALSSSFLVS